MNLSSQSYFSLFCLFLAVCQNAGAESDFVNLKLQLEKRGFHFETFENVSQFSTSEPKVVIEFLKISHRVSGPGFERVKQEIGSAASQNSGVEEYIREKIDSLPVLVENSDQRMTYFQILSVLKAEWATTLAGEHLRKMEPLSTERGDLEFVKSVSNGFWDNASIAAWVIGCHGYHGYPGSNQIGDYDQTYVNKCRSWWIEFGIQSRVLGEDIKVVSPKMHGEDHKLSDSERSGGSTYHFSIFLIVLTFLLIVFSRIYTLKRNK